MSADPGTHIEVEVQEPEPEFRLNEQQRNAVAMMAVSGAQPADIARSVGRSTQTIKKILRSDADVRQRIAHYESKLLKVMSQHHFEMISMLDQARLNIQEGLHSTDLKVRLDTSWKLNDYVAPAKTQRVEVGVELTGETRHEIVAGVAAIASTLADIKTHGATGTPSYLRSIKAELPGPTSLPTPNSTPVEEPQDGLAS